MQVQGAGLKAQGYLERLSCKEQCEKVNFLLDELEMEMGKTIMIERRCAWCGCSLGEKPADGSAMKYGNVTDGMCDECQVKFRCEYDEYRERRANGGK